MATQTKVAVPEAGQEANFEETDTRILDGPPSGLLIRIKETNIAQEIFKALVES